MNARTRPEGAIVDVIDLTGLEELASTWATRLDPSQHHAGRYDQLRIGFAPWAMLDAADGSTWLVSTEGTGSRFAHGPRSEEPYVELPVFAKTCKSGSEGVLPMLPVATVVLSLREARSLVRDQCDLARFVRTFGERLEANFAALWQLAT